MRNITISLFLISAILLNSGCALILTGSKQKVTFKSDYDGKVYQNLTEIGKTNEEIKILRANLTNLFTVKVEGCPDEQLVLPIKFNPAFYLNIFNGVFFGGYFDLNSRANLKTDKIINVGNKCKSKK